LLLLKEG